MPPEIDNSGTTDKVEKVATALEDAAMGLANIHPLNTGPVVAALDLFPDQQSQANALCSAVKQLNPKHVKANKETTPPLLIVGEKGGTDLANLGIYTVLIDNANKQHPEPIFVFPLSQKALANLRCDEVPSSALSQQVGKLPPSSGSTTPPPTDTAPPSHKP